MIPQNWTIFYFSTIMLLSPISYMSYKMKSLKSIKIRIEVLD